MNNQSNIAIAMPARPSVTGERAEGSQPIRLEVNVIFTSPQATAAALKTARSLARDLGARICLRAPIVVPYALPLDEPPVSVGFIEKLLSKLICRMELDSFEPSVHLYLCRDRIETLLRVLNPKSLVVIGGRKRWWPTEERRIANALRSKGHRVVLLSLKRNTGSDLR